MKAAQLLKPSAPGVRVTRARLLQHQVPVVTLQAPADVLEASVSSPAPHKLTDYSSSTVDATPLLDHLFQTTQAASCMPDSSSTQDDLDNRSWRSSQQQQDALLTAHIACCSTAGELQALVDSHGTALNPIHCSAVLSRLVRLHRLEESSRTYDAPSRADGSRGGAMRSATDHEASKRRRAPGVTVTQKLVRQVEGLMQAHLTSSSSAPSHTPQQGRNQPQPRQLSKVLACFVRLGHMPSSRYMQATYDAIQRRIGSFSPVLTSELLWALARLSETHEPDPQCLQSLCSLAAGRAEHYTARQAATTLWALARLQHTPSLPWLHRWLGLIKHRLSEATAYDLSQCVWALATLHIAAPASWLSAVLSRSSETLHTFSPQDTGNLLWGLAKMGYHPGQGFLHACLGALAGSNLKMARLAPIDFASLMWTLGKLRYSPPQPQLLASFTSHLPQLLPRMGSQDVSHVLWALARLRFLPSAPVARSLLARASALLPHAGPQALVLFLWSCVKLRLRPGINTMLQVTLAATQHAEAGVLSPQGVALLLFCMQAQDQRPSPSLMGALLVCIDVRTAGNSGSSLLPRGDGHADRGMSSAREASGAGDDAVKHSALSCSSSMGSDSSRSHTQSMAVSAACQLGPQCVSLLLWSMARVRYGPPHAWLRRLLVHSVHELPRMTAREQVALLYALATFSHAPEPPWLSVFVQCVEQQAPQYNAAGARCLMRSMWLLRAHAGVDADGMLTQQAMQALKDAGQLGEAVSRPGLQK